MLAALFNALASLFTTVPRACFQSCLPTSQSCALERTPALLRLSRSALHSAVANYPPVLN